MAKKAEKRPYVVIRNDMAGVLCGVLEERTDSETTLTEARIIWDWSNPGVETVHEVASIGVGPASHVSCAVPRMTVHIRSR